MSITVERVHELYEAAVAADDEWMARLRTYFPGRRPGDVRYTKEGIGEPGGALRAAHDKFQAAIREWQAAVDERRAQEK